MKKQESPGLSRGEQVKRATFLIGLLVIVGLGATGLPGPMLTAGVVLALLVTAHQLITSPDNPKDVA